MRERIGLAALAAEGMRRAALARMRRSRLLRWRHRAPIAHELLLAPPDLRPVDPSFADEVASGSMGLAGLTVALNDASPFAVPAPSRTLLTAGSAGGCAMPASTTTSSAPAARARTQTAAPPEVKLATIWRVTSCGYALTPSAATP